MFERFTDRARRVVVLAQEEARMLNHNYIGTEHILLGLLHEGEGVAAAVLTELGLSLDAVRDYVEEIIGQGQQAPVGHIPFTPSAKKVLELSLREALQLGHNYIGTEHILLGLVRQRDGVAAVALTRNGIELSTFRATALLFLAQHYSLTKAARNGPVGRVIGREQEIAELTRALQPGAGRLPLLVGEHGVGVTTVVHGLVTALLDPGTAEELAGLEVVQFDLRQPDPAGDAVPATASAVARFLAARPELIVFVRNLLVDERRAGEALEVLRPALAAGAPRIIGAATPGQYRAAARGTLAGLFDIVEVSELPEDLVIEVMHEERDSFQARHRVAIPDEVLTTAVALSRQFRSDRQQPGRSLDLLEQAAAVAAARAVADPRFGAQDALTDVRTRKEAALDAQDFELAARLRDEEKQLLARQDDRAWKNFPTHRVVGVTEADIAEALRHDV